MVETGSFIKVDFNLISLTSAFIKASLFFNEVEKWKSQ